MNTNQGIPNRTTHHVEAIFTVHPHTDEHLQSEQGIRDELASWLESLRAEVVTVTVRPIDTPDEGGPR